MATPVVATTGEGRPPRVGHRWLHVRGDVSVPGRGTAVPAQGPAASTSGPRAPVGPNGTPRPQPAGAGGYGPKAPPGRRGGRPRLDAARATPRSPPLHSPGAH